MTRPRLEYANPYFSGVGLGLVLLAAFVLAGRGLGASGAFASVAAAVSAKAETNSYFAGYLQNGGPAHDWLVFELAGVIIGAFASAWFGGRHKQPMNGSYKIIPQDSNTDVIPKKAR